MKSEMRRGLGCVLGPAAALAALWLLLAVSAAAGAANAAGAVEQVTASPTGMAPVLVPLSARTRPGSAAPEAGSAPQLVQIDFQKSIRTTFANCDPPDDKVVTFMTSTMVAYCFKVYNTGTVTLTHHIVTDTQLGPVLNANFTLAPGAGVFFTVTKLIAATVVNTATWTASNPGPSDEVSDTDSATVAVLFLHGWLPLLFK